MAPATLSITGVTPALGIPGGEVSISCRGFRPGMQSAVLFGDEPAAVATASEDRVIARLPSSPRGLGLTLHVGDRTSKLYPFALAVTLAAELQPVTSPVVAPDRSVITTVSGSRGQEVPNPLIRVTRSGERVPFACDIMNPTGLAFGPDGQLYVSSRHDGTVYRYRDFEELEPVADDLGIACGLAFDSQGMLYVGDRAGRIIRLDPFGDMRAEYARLEPSVSAYHLAMDADDVLYVTGPTLAMRDPLYRIAGKGQIETVVQGLARPQGMAFTPAGELLIATSYAGKKGIFRLAPGSTTLEHYIAGPTLVGIAASGEDLFPANGTAVYWIQQPVQNSQPRISLNP